MFTYPRRLIVALLFSGCLFAPLAAYAQNDNPSLVLMTLAGDNGRTFDIHYSPADLVFDVTRATDRAGGPSALLTIVGSLIGDKEGGFVEDRAFNDEVWNECPAVYRITTASEATKKALELARVSDAAWVIAGASLRYTLFLPDATPTRATVQVRLKQASRASQRDCKEPRR